MKVFTDKRIWQKIIIVLIILFFIQLVTSVPVHAGTGVLLEPVTNLLARLGDGLMNIMQKTFMDMGASGVWIKQNNNLWLKIFLVLAAIMIATVAVAATIVSGGAALTIVGTAIGAVIRIAGGAAVAYMAVETLHLGNKGFFLPEYELTPQAIFKDEILIFDVNFFNPKPTKSGKESIARDLQATVSAWYNRLRDIAIIALMSVLVYIGIRITITSISSEKAKYKEMLVDWVVALCLVFFMNYIMSFACTINSKIIDALKTITIYSYGGDAGVLGQGAIETDVKTEAKKGENNKEADGTEEIEDAGVQMFIITGKEAELAKKQLIGESGQEKKKDKDGNVVSHEYSDYNNRFKDGKLYWPVNDFMAQARLLGQKIDKDSSGNEENKNQTAVARAGYNIIYVVLVLYTLYFAYIYLRRVVYMAFLTIISPLVAITYPIDKLNDGQAQAFNMWLREYIFNLLMQPMHLILYTVLIGMAMRFAATNIFYAVVATGFILPAEKMLRNFFGFEKAKTPGTFSAASAAGTGLMMAGLNKVISPKSSEKEKDKNKEENDKGQTIREKDLSDTDMLLGNTDSGMSRDEIQNKLNLAKQGKEEAKAGIKRAISKDDKNNYRELKQNHKQDIKKYKNLNKAAIKADKKRKIARPKSGIGRGLEHYGKGLVKKYKARGGLLKGTLRTLAGIKLGAIAATAGGIIGIATGDPTKALQYTTTGAFGGYATGKGIVNRVSDKIVVPGTIKAMKQKDKDNKYENIKTRKVSSEITKKEKEELNKTAEKINKEKEELEKEKEGFTKTKEDIERYFKSGITSKSDLKAVLRLEMELGLEQDKSIEIENYANKVFKGEDTRKISIKKRKEYIDKMSKDLKEKGNENPEEEANELLRNIDKFHEFKK